MRNGVRGNKGTWTKTEALPSHTQPSHVLMKSPTHALEFPRF